MIWGRSLFPEGGVSVGGLSGSGSGASLGDVLPVTRAAAIAALYGSRSRYEEPAAASTPVRDRAFTGALADQTASDSPSSSSSSASTASLAGEGDSGRGGTGSTFLAQLLGQGEGDSTLRSGIASILVAIGAYAGAAGSSAESANTFPGAEVILPFGRPLASGHAIDLSV
jgi:hypothetical protein